MLAFLSSTLAAWIAIGAAGPSRDKRKPDVEDADFMVIRDRWRVGVPEDPRFKKGNILNPYRQNILKALTLLELFLAAHHLEATARPLPSRAATLCLRDHEQRV